MSVAFNENDLNWPDVLNGLVAMPTIFCSAVMAIGHWEIALVVIVILTALLLVLGIAKEFFRFPVITQLLVLMTPVILFLFSMTYVYESGMTLKVLMILTLASLHVASNLALKHQYRNKE